MCMWLDHRWQLQGTVHRTKGRGRPRVSHVAQSVDCAMKTTAAMQCIFGWRSFDDRRLQAAANSTVRCHLMVDHTPLADAACAPHQVFKACAAQGEY
jgi:hypothetical protein